MKNLNLKTHPQFNERWLQERIIEDPSVLRLGPVVVVAVERHQKGGGRLDLLLSQAESGVRYTVELQLGALDESHLFRTLEYWDYERRTNPGIKHIPVVVAESASKRYRRLVGLLGLAVPLTFVEIRAVQVGDAIGLDARIHPPEGGAMEKPAIRQRPPRGPVDALSVVKLAHQGHSQRRIAELLGISKTSVSRALTRCTGDAAA
ncbi:hypothetical protein GCM10027090_11960 [Sinomonas soli]